MNSPPTLRLAIGAAIALVLVRVHRERGRLAPGARQIRQTGFRGITIVRFVTWSSSFKRTARSIISFTDFRVRTRGRTVSTGAARKSRSARFALRRSGISSTIRRVSSALATVRARIPERTAKWTASTKSTGSVERPDIRDALTRTRRTATCQASRRSRTSSLVNIMFLPMRCFRRTSTRAASSLTNTSLQLRASSAVNYPIGPWGCEGGSGDMIPTVTQQRTIGGSVEPCFNNRTLGGELDNAGVSWRYYTSTVHGGGGAWSAYQAIKHIYYGDDWSKDVITPQTRFFNDVSNGTLPAVSWITPTCVNSDHAGCGSNTGPDWVASLVNAIGESQYWDSTVHLRLLGRLWRLVRSRSTQTGRLRRAGNSRSAISGFGVRQERVRVARALRARQHPEVRRRPVAVAEALGERRARQPHRRRTASTSRGRRGPLRRYPLRAARSTFSGSRSTHVRPIRSRRRNLTGY